MVEVFGLDKPERSESPPMPAIDIIFVVIVGFALMALKLFNSLRAMQIQMGVGVVLSVYESPVLFWIVMALQCLALGALLALIYVACFVLPNSVMF